MCVPSLYLSCLFVCFVTEYVCVCDRVGARVCVSVRTCEGTHAIYNFITSSSNAEKSCTHIDINEEKYTSVCFSFVE